MKNLSITLEHHPFDNFYETEKGKGIFCAWKVAQVLQFKNPPAKIKLEVYRNRCKKGLSKAVLDFREGEWNSCYVTNEIHKRMYGFTSPDLEERDVTLVGNAWDILKRWLGEPENPDELQTIYWKIEAID
jgi:hypothetical protein